MSETPTYQRFYENLTAFFNYMSDVISMLVNQKRITNDKLSDIIKLVNIYLKSFATNDHKIAFIENFIFNSNKAENELCWGKVKSRDVEFFKKNAKSIFPNINPDYIDLIAKIVTEKDSKGEEYILKDEKEYIWESLDALIRIAIVYSHEKRKPVKNDQSGKYTYTAVYMQNMHLSVLMKEWGVKV